MEALASLSLERLTVETLDKVDFGKAAMAFQRHLARAVHDCEESEVTP